MVRFVVKTRRGKLDVAQTRSVWTRFARYTRAHVLALVLAFLASLGVMATQVAAPWPIKVIFDHVLSDKMKHSWIATSLSRVAHSPAAVLGWVCGAILAIAVLDALCCYVRDVQLAQIGQRVVGKIRQDLFAHLQKLPPSEYERQKTGGLLTRLTGDITMLRQMLVDALITSVQSVLTIGVLVATMFWLNPTLALVAIATAPLTAWSSWRISRQIRRATKQQREKESEVAAIAHEVLGAMAIVQAFNREKIEHKRFSQQNRRSVRAGVKTTRLESKLYRIISLASAAALCAILYVGVRAVLAGTMTAGDLLVFISYLRGVNKPIRNVAKLTAQVAKATACGQRVAELFAIEPAVRNAPGARALGPIAGTVDFEQVGFTYEGNRPALSDLTLRVAVGERVAIVGPTGAGKSTLMKLLLRFYDPQQGRLLVDGNDLREVTTESLRRQILFGMSIAENITSGRVDASEALVRDVAARVHADEFIDKLPDGYDTVLGQDGATLSGGQRQRLALARALLREPRILLLDEPAVGLDPLTRRVVEQAWLAPTNAATTLIIAHRFHDMSRFDRVVFLCDGQVRAVGPHEELLKTCRDYAALVAAGTDGRQNLKLSEYLAS
jgi:ATP-binding cassette subfamily B protein